MPLKLPTRFVLLGILVWYVTVLPAGCSSGPATGTVQGKVTFQGKPVTEGLVTLLNPTEGGSAEARIGKDGTFRIASPVIVGDYLVLISPLSEIVDSDPGRSPPAPMEKAAPDIPPNYRNQGTTPLRATVAVGENVRNFDMTP